MHGYSPRWKASFQRLDCLHLDRFRRASNHRQAELLLPNHKVEVRRDACFAATTCRKPSFTRWEGDGRSVRFARVLSESTCQMDIH